MAKTRCTGASVVVVALAREERVLNALLSRIDTIVPPPTPKVRLPFFFAFSASINCSISDLHFELNILVG
ncbi:hypothetical protein RND71_001864 [Anisodus tanguticus]|uniref:Uncharacterized protein n=1 Tax=Anisodus tanguticus TaxID=243964 RepID=A0AAE1VSL1_9SOLA|nr:hypothetical protein RND71_001864 [Anisodus tanguticus]